MSRFQCRYFETQEEAFTMKRYGYHRTSTREHYLGRGVAEITHYCSANNLELMNHTYEIPSWKECTLTVEEAPVYFWIG